MGWSPSAGLALIECSRWTVTSSTRDCPPLLEPPGHPPPPTPTPHSRLSEIRGTFNPPPPKAKEEQLGGRKCRSKSISRGK